MLQETFLSFITDSSLQGRKRKYFAYSDKNMVSPVRVKSGDAEVCVETNLSANATSNLIKKMIAKYEIDKENYHVYYKADYSDLHK